MPSRRYQIAGIVAGGLGAIIVAVAMVTPPNLYVTPVSSVAIGLAALTRRRGVVWGLAATLSIAAFLPMLLGTPPISPTPGPWLFWTNRLLVAAAILATAAVADRWITTQAALDRERQRLAHQNQVLEEVNSELSARETEIASQNEELHLQGEELERQTEELRVANDDLVGRERVLAQLLDLSRAMAAEVTADAVMARVCDALTIVLSPRASAAALLMRADDEVRVVCHVGFGDTPPDVDRIPVAQSFSSLVQTRGQTGYVFDLGRRPDLRIPQPREGPRFTSILAAPIWVRGGAVGTLEVYATEPTHWSDDDVGLISSLAAQAGSSLHGARLFEEVEDGRRRLAALFSTLPIPVLVAEDAEARTVRGNPAAAALFNAPADANFSPLAAPPRRVRPALYADGSPVHAADYPLVRSVRHGEEIIGAAYDLLAPAARRLSLLLSSAPIRDGRGAIVGAVCAFIDVTSQKALERELEARRREAEESSARKTRFLAAVSHDIRTPANAIGLQAELIRRTAEKPDLASSLPKLAADLQRSAALLVDLVSEILDFTRLDSGRLDLQEDDFALGAVVAEECRQLAPLAAAKGLVLRGPGAELPIWLHADRVKLGRVVGNLVDNAIKFTERGEVRVTVTLDPARRPLIVVEDTGSGILPEHRGRVFDEFFQLRNPERDRSKGLGLGLAICRRLVEAMGGEIGVESTPGRGTRFSVALPATAAIPPPVHVSAPPRAAGGLRGLRVLVAEDDEDTRHALVRILSDEGAEVIEAPDGMHALRTARTALPHVLLLDLMMPGIDGTEVLRALAVDRPAGLLRIVVLTADRASRSEVDLARLGADAVVHKPLDPDRLVGMLCDVVPASIG